jgi:hypothetical protein
VRLSRLWTPWPFIEEDDYAWLRYPGTVGLAYVGPWRSIEGRMSAMAAGLTLRPMHVRMRAAAEVATMPEETLGYEALLIPDLGEAGPSLSPDERSLVGSLLLHRARRSTMHRALGERRTVIYSPSWHALECFGDAVVDLIRDEFTVLGPPAEPAQDAEVVAGVRARCKELCLDPGAAERALSRGQEEASRAAADRGCELDVDSLRRMLMRAVTRERVLAAWAAQGLDPADGERLVDELCEQERSRLGRIKAAEVVMGLIVKAEGIRGRPLPDGPLHDLWSKLSK